MTKRFVPAPVVKISLWVFIAAELVLFPLIQLTPGDVSSFCSYIAIVCVALFALVSYKKGEKRNLLRLGILLTLVADYFLVLCDDAQLEGVIAFIFVQAAYCVYLVLTDGRRCVRKINIVSRTLLSMILVAIGCIVLGEDTDLLAIASVIYYGNLVANTVFAFILGKKERIFAIGLLLFCMCDLCIGLEVLFDSYLHSDALSFFYGAHINLPWIFYQPSQTLIGAALYKREQ